MTFLTWLVILVCLSQSALLSGLNLGLFSLSKLELKTETRKGDHRARRLLEFREDANFALVTILWGNVGVNVILALVSGSLLTGVGAFLFSTVVITVFAEIIPQAYFTRNAIRLAALLSPLLRFYQLLLYPVAKPTAWALDRWLGGEEIRYFRERDLRHMIQLHMDAAESDISRVEGQGALNFLDIDDVPLDREGEPVDPESILELEFDGERPLFPRIEPHTGDPLLQRINRSGKRWVVVVDAEAVPRLLLSSDDFIREALFSPERFSPHRHCHRPIVLTDGRKKLGEVIQTFTVGPAQIGEEVLEDDVILLWNAEPRVITGSDILGRLLRGISRPPTSGPTGPGDPLLAAG